MSAIKDRSRFFLGVSPVEDPESVNPKTLLKASALNRSCGDAIDLHLTIQTDTNGKTLGRSLHYSGYFCAVCHASSELMCSEWNEFCLDLLGPGSERPASLSFAQAMAQVEVEQTRESIREWNPMNSEPTRTLALLLESLEPFRVRYQCAALPWKALGNLLEQDPTLGKLGVKTT